ncbi:MAG: M28 family peptidase [Phycisphaerae bacterium]
MILRKPTRPLRLIVPLLLLAGICRAGEDRSADHEALFNTAAYVEHVRYLASDELAGRLPGTDGGRAATDYIAERFKEFGLKPAGVDGSYFQPFTIRRLKKLNEERATFKIIGIDQDWKVRQDWMPMPFSKPGKIEGPLAFAGYGVEAPDHGYNDYADFDAEGKVLLILRHEPKADDPEADFGGEAPSRHARFVKKARTAAKKGAKALLIVNAPNRDPDKDELYPWHSWNTRQSYALPMAHISREMADAILRHAQMPDLKTLQEKLDGEHQALSADLKDVAVDADTGIEYLEGRNVLGLLEGDGSTDEVIVIGAHHDHLGTVPSHSGETDKTPVIHNGADDNASGTAGVLELARVFAAGPRHRRSLLFMTFEAEELGLLGSKHFLEHPTVALDEVRAMINLDMIGRLNQERLTLFGVPTGKEFGAILRSAADPAALEFKTPGTNAGYFGSSDHFAFYRKEIPVLFAFTGVHKQYHRPEDDWELIDGEGATKLLQTMHAVVSELANMEAGPTFVSQEEQEEEATTRPAEEREEEVAQERPDRRRPRVRLGFMPDYTNEEGGLLVDAVIPGGPAQKGGMKDGDRIVRIGEYTISDMYSYMDTLKNFKAGDEVEVIVERDGKQVTLKIKLEASRRRPRPDDE